MAGRSAPFGTDLNPMGRVRIIGGRQVEIGGDGAGPASPSPNGPQPQPQTTTTRNRQGLPSQINSASQPVHAGPGWQHSGPGQVAAEVGWGGVHPRGVGQDAQDSRSQQNQYPGHPTDPRSQVQAQHAPAAHGGRNQVDQWGRPHAASRRQPSDLRTTEQHHARVPDLPPSLPNMAAGTPNQLPGRSVVPPIAERAPRQNLNIQQPSPSDGQAHRYRSPRQAIPEHRGAAHQGAVRSHPTAAGSENLSDHHTSSQGAIGAKYTALPSIQKNSSEVSTPPFADTSYSEKVFRRQLRSAPLESVERLLLQLSELPPDGRRCVDRTAVFTILRQSTIRFSTPDVVHVLKVLDTYDNATIPLDRLYGIIAEASPDARRPDSSVAKKKAEKVAPIVKHWRGRDHPPHNVPSDPAPSEANRLPPRQADGAYPDRSASQQWHDLEGRYDHGAHLLPVDMAPAEEGWADPVDDGYHPNEALSERIQQLNASRLSLDNHIKMYSFTTPRPVAMAAPEGNSYYP